jgi:hypothetical protein
MFSAALQKRRKAYPWALVATLALGWLSAPVALGLQAEDVCGSACCVNAGHCCCVSHHARVEGQQSDGKNTIGKPTASSRCPDGCGSGSVSTQLPCRDIDSDAGASLVDTGRACHLAARACVNTDSVLFNSFPPRAPPISLG